MERELMKRLKAAWETPGNRLVILIGAVVALFVAAVILTVVRYDESRSADRNAINVRQTQFFAQQVRTNVTDEGGVADAYAGDRNAADLSDLDQIRRSLAQSLEALKNSTALVSAEAGIVPFVSATQ